MKISDEKLRDMTTLRLIWFREQYLELDKDSEEAKNIKMYLNAQGYSELFDKTTDSE